ncbi:UDP-2-acetamido-2,6-beta-L-arabino-hexul-4-ose reductase [Butyrivibrio fibrisolvens DSM 3071]|uniref:UDP-2-acetamido-2,6-beta-L-arabino-hexul-4-ose reductase n=1 Tax=Butyrivibrio fibrisolvens DSM 3071 TaxID=1121131 RepID=A0A1M6ETB6_BUTFI|nr:NAD-dependent epimerase/dehydratase family protein [Butyrivibrio fibrisolvens]SHI88663.1 UDP-2-acetamido-2,6-beta-L-arabino-hexul-4-ose reductase [Butyrivibrio fibrisolvens DSM 3071]
MRILVTGSNGFVGRNLVWNLKNLRDGRNNTRPNLTITEIYGYDIGTSDDILENACERADFVFNLAGVNRPKDNAEFMAGNFGFASKLLDTLKKYNNTCPVMLSSSIQASLVGRFEGSEYGKSKLAGEELFMDYQKKTGSKVLVYRFPNLFGKWCKPNYNSAVATFCNAVANDLEYKVNDRATELELLYIDDLIEEMLDALEGKEHRCEYEVAGGSIDPTPKEDGRYCYVPTTHKATLGEIVDLLNSFKEMPSTLVMPSIPEGSFAKKLYSTYLSYLPAEKMCYDFKSNIDHRGTFTELIRTLDHGQVSINVAKPGITRGQHWHNSKWEIFIVVSGHGLIQQRRIGIDPETCKGYPVIEFEVTGEQMKAIQMIPGYTHNIINLSKTQDLVTVMWANESFDQNHPDTFYEIVDRDGDEKINAEKGNV